MRRPRLPSPHQYIDRLTGRVVDEQLVADRLVGFLYNQVRERAGRVFEALTSPRASSLLGWLRYDLSLARSRGGEELLARLGADPAELLDEPAALDTARKVFERRLRYWDCRPLDPEPDAVASPCDARLLMGSLGETSALFIKDKFFDLAELLGGGNRRWVRAFRGGDFALFRLTPDKYHYNHAPVSGAVMDHYRVEGRHHSCNPQVVLSLAEPCSKNQRHVTIIDSDLPGGSRAGLVAMVEVVALMIGAVEQCYSERGYEDPQPMRPGLWLRRGQPKSLFRPGSSTVVLLFQPGRVSFDRDLLTNLRAPAVRSRFSRGLGETLVETDVRVRSRIALARPPASPNPGE